MSSKFHRTPIVISNTKIPSVLLRSVSLLLCFGLLSCSDPRQEQMQRDLETSKQEVNQIKGELARAQKDLGTIKQILGRSKLGEQPIFPATFETSKAYHLDDPFLGQKDSNVIVMAFLDFECEPCRDFVKNVMPQIVEEFVDKKRIQFIARDYPLPANRQALRAAALANCVGEQGKYWEAFNMLYDNPDAIEKGEFLQVASGIQNLDQQKLKRCFNSQRPEVEAEQDGKDAVKMGVRGVPGLFVGRKNSAGNFDGVFVRGAQPYPVIRNEIAKVLNQKPTPASTLP